MTTRRDFLGGFLLPSLTSAWFADRAPGAGKLLIVNGVTTGVNGVVALGQPGSGGSSTPPTSYPPALPAPGSVIPPPGSSDRSGYLIVFAASTGFNGSSQLSIPTHTDAKTWSFSVWLNYGVDNTLGFVPDFNLGSIIIPANGATATYAGTSAFELDPSLSGDSGPRVLGLVNSTHNSVTYPADGTTGRGFFHLMASAKVSGSDSGTITERVQCYINDSEVFDTTQSVAGSGGSKLVTYPFSATGLGGTANMGIGGVNGPDVGTDVYVAMNELWEAPGQYIDWSVRANRYKFHISDGFAGSAFQTFAPCSLGPTGALPTGTKPRLYLSGGPINFIKNRANAGATLTLLGSALVLVDDVPQ